MSMGGTGSQASGTAKGQSRTQNASESAAALAKLAEQFGSETTGIRTGLIEAMQEVLTTGGSSIPIISSAVESSRKASSRALTETDAELAQSGLAGTPFGEDILATQRQSGEQSVSQTQQSMAKDIFGMISNFVLGQSQTATGGLAGAIPGDITTRENAKTTGTSQGSSFSGGKGQ